MEVTSVLQTQTHHFLLFLSFFCFHMLDILGVHFQIFFYLNIIENLHLKTLREKDRLGIM